MADRSSAMDAPAAATPRVVPGARGARRMPAEARRALVLRAAVSSFAGGGYAGTSTEDVAAAAGISQPYLFRLFPTKRDLFVATIDLMHLRIEETFRQAAHGRHGAEALEAMGQAYLELLGERDLLRLQLHAFAAAAGDDEAIRQAGRVGFARLWQVVVELTSLPESAVRGFFAQGMLLNAMAALDGAGLDEPWARSLCTPDPTSFLGG